MSAHYIYVCRGDCGIYYQHTARRTDLSCKKCGQPLDFVCRQENGVMHVEPGTIAALKEAVPSAAGDLDLYCGVMVIEDEPAAGDEKARGK